MSELKPTFTEAPNCKRVQPPDVRASAALASVLESISNEKLPYGSTRKHIPPTSRAVCFSAVSVEGDVEGDSERIYLPVVSVEVGRDTNNVILGTCFAGDACIHCGET